MNNQYPNQPWGNAKRIPLPTEQSFDEGAQQYAQQAIDTSAQRMPLIKTGKTRNVAPGLPVELPTEQKPHSTQLKTQKPSSIRKPVLPRIAKPSFPIAKFAERVAVASLTFAALYLMEGSVDASLYSKAEMVLNPLVMIAIFTACFLMASRHQLKGWIASILFVLRGAFTSLLNSQLLLAWILGYSVITAWLGT